MADKGERDPASILGSASIYLGTVYPFIKRDVYRHTPERRAAEILCALKDLVELSDWDVDYSLPKRGTNV